MLRRSSCRSHPRTWFEPHRATAIRAGAATRTKTNSDTSQMPPLNQIMDESATPSVRSELEYHVLDDGGVIHDASADRVHTLNATAAYVWNSLDGSRSLKQIALDLQEHFN